MNLGMSSGASANKDTPTRQSYDVIADSFGEGYYGPLLVAAAALIRVSVFSGFIFTDDIVIKQIGFALAFGILVDAFLLHMIFVPAVMSMFGDKIWWLPKWLDKLLPDLDIEGEKLLEELNKEENTI